MESTNTASPYKNKWVVVGPLVHRVKLRKSGDDRIWVNTTDAYWEDQVFDSEKEAMIYARANAVERIAVLQNHIVELDKKIGYESTPFDSLKPGEDVY